MPKFFRRGKSKLDFLPAVANPAAPTALEITAGESLDSLVAEINGFDFTGSRIPTPNLADNFTPQITGEDTVGDASLVFWDDDTNDDVRTALEKGTIGYLLFRPYGAGTGKRAEVWHVETQSVSDRWTVGNEAAQFQVGFAVLDPPEQDAVLP
jgi:hypothetical protein